MTAPGNRGSYIATTEIFDIEDPLELRKKLHEVINEIALVLNIKESGLYPEEEFVTGSQYFPPTTPLSGKTSAFRNVYRRTYNFGALPNTTSQTLAHGLTISANTSFVRIYGAASDTTGNTYIPLPFASPTLANNISVEVNATNIVVTTGSNRSNFDVSYIVLEYLQDGV